MHPKRKANPQAKRPKVSDEKLDEMVAKAWSAGWWARKTGKNKVMCYSPDGGHAVLVANTPSDKRTAPNTRKYFRRAGLDL